MPANILNSGTPLASVPSAPLWIDKCDASSNLTNTAAPPDLVIPLTATPGAGTVEIPTWVKQLDAIEQVLLSGTMKGKRGDTISVNLKHEIYGTVALLANHAIEGDLTVPYPVTGEDRLLTGGNLGILPPNFVFKEYVGEGTEETVTLPDGIDPGTVYPANSSYGYSDPSQWFFQSRIPGGTPYQISVPAHRYPYAPDYNYDNAPGATLVNGGLRSLQYRGFSFVLNSTGNATYEPAIVGTRTFDNLVFDNGTSSSVTAGYYSTGTYPWSDFNSNFSEYANNGSFTEQLFANYGAHDWIITKVIRTVTQYIVPIPPIDFFVATHVVDTYYVTFLKWPDIQWTVFPMGQSTYGRVVYGQMIYTFYPPDYADYLALAERSEALALELADWKGNAADGVWKLEIISTSTLPSALTTPGSPTPTYAPSVTPAIVRIDNLVMTIQFKPNAQYAAAALATTPPAAGTVQAYTQGNLRSNGEDRAFVGILCGVNGSSTMGFLCGYSVLRIGRNGEIYNISYFLARTCNVNHANMTRNAQAVSYWAQNWGDRPFSTKGDAAEAFVMGPTQHRIYPVRGQIGLQVQVTGNKLVFQLMGTEYPPLVVLDPTVPLINKFTRLSLNA